MVKFCDILKRKSESEAYMNGVDDFYDRLSNKTLIMRLVSPYIEGSKADEDWLDGYMDAYFLHYGELIDKTRD